MKFNTRQFRNALGCFATGVCVVTAKGDGGRMIGLTVNSFSSVSLKPPLVLWSLGRDSWAWDEFGRAKAFSVHVLGEVGRALSQYFAKRNVKADAAHLRALGRALAQLDCRIIARIEAGDHVIIVGRVLKFAHKQGKPLLYHRGRYGKLAEK